MLRRVPGRHPATDLIYLSVKFAVNMLVEFTTLLNVVS
jgi:hypothetical protein